MPSELLPLVDVAQAGAQNKSNFVNSMLGNLASNIVAKKQYERQRKDALSDWNMQNEYNSPAAQMQRLKDAGLNPHLVYGNGATATSSSQPRSSEMKSISTQAAQANNSASIMGIYDAQVKQAQSNNLQVQLDVLKQEKELKAAQTVATLLGIEWKKFDLGIKSDLRNTTIETAKAKLNQIQAETRKTDAATQFTLDENQRKWALQAPTLEAAIQRVINMKTDNENVKQQMQLRFQQILKTNKEFQILEEQYQNWWKRGANPANNPLNNVLNRIIDGVFNIDPGQYIKGAADKAVDQFYKGSWMEKTGKYLERFSPY